MVRARLRRSIQTTQLDSFAFNHTLQKVLLKNEKILTACVLRDRNYPTAPGGMNSTERRTYPVLLHCSTLELCTYLGYSETLIKARVIPSSRGSDQRNS
jgi:hypothetical protein